MTNDLAPAATTEVLPMPVVTAETLPAKGEQHDAEIKRRMAEVDIRDSGSVIAFGSGAQQKLQETSRGMLEGVRNKDLGIAGDGLNKMVTVLRGFSVEKGDLNDKPGFLGKLMGKATPLARFKARFDGVLAQINEIALSLQKHQNTLLKDLSALDRLYEETLSFYHNLSLYIEAGERRISEIEEVDIAAKTRDLEVADENDKMIVASELRDLQSIRDDLQRRVHDMKLTRQVTMQSLPSIRLVQENDKSLIAKISSTLTNTVPLWETQLAQAITIQRSADAAASLKTATDLTNELLTANAANLRQANVAVREQMERGVFDIESIRKANEDLIGTIEDSLRIADEGKTRRAEAELELQRMEGDLRQSLQASGARKVA